MDNSDDQTSTPSDLTSLGWLRKVLDSDLSTSAKMVATVLFSHMDRRGGSCFPSHETIAAKASMSYWSVKRQVAALRDSGWVESTVIRKGEGRGSRVSYQASLPTTRGGITTVGLTTVGPCSDQGWNLLGPGVESATISNESVTSHEREGSTGEEESSTTAVRPAAPSLRGAASDYEAWLQKKEAEGVEMHPRYYDEVHQRILGGVTPLNLEGAQGLVLATLGDPELTLSELCFATGIE